MRKLGIVAAVLTLSVLLQTAMCFAGTLEIVDSYPRDGGTGLQPINCAVKVYFNQEITNEDLMLNTERFTFKDEENNILPSRVFHNPKDPTMVLVVVENDLASNTEYTLTISGDFVLLNNNTLESEKTITFRTRDLGSDTNAMMGLMIVMFVLMMIFTSRQMKKQAEKDAKDKKVNPYKVSKETGKSVEEIVKKTEKERKRKAELEAKYQKAPKKKRIRDEDEDDDLDDVDEFDLFDYGNDNKKVKGPRPISAAGSKYRSGKKAKAEREAAKKAKEIAAAKAAGTTKPKHQTGKAKNKKK